MNSKTKKVMVTNSAGVAEIEAVFERMSFNVSSDVAIREEVLDGDPHWVVPMVMASECVMNGSLGALYYPKEELSKKISAWNHKPIVVYHPDMNVSACDPVILNKQKIGVILNTSFLADNKLRAEAWIHKELAEKIDKRIVEAITNKSTMELSTGLEVEIEFTGGDFNGKSYTGIARNYTPDHLAILPDEIGACSLGDGAGFIRNSEGKTVVKSLHRALQAYGLTMNVMSHSDIRESLRDALNTFFKDTETSVLTPYGVSESKDSSRLFYDLWVVEVYDDHFIYEISGDYYKLFYTKTDEVVSVTGTPKKVVRKVSYEAAPATSVQNKDNKENKDMNRKEKIDALVSNGAFVKEDIELLTGMTDAQFDRVHNQATTAAAHTAAAEAGSGDDEKEAAAKAATEAEAAQNKKALSVEDYIKAAPVEMQAVLNEGRTALQKETSSLVATIVANKKCIYTEEQLRVKPIIDLRAIAALAANSQEEAPARVPYAAPMADASHTQNAADGEGLSIPATYGEAK